MTKLVILLSLSVLWTAEAVPKSARDLVDEAQQQLNELESIVQGNILVARNDISGLNLDFLTNSHNILVSGGLDIEQQNEAVQQQLSTLKELANTVHADISPCTDIREELLNRLPDEYNNLIRNCIFDKNREEADFISQANYVIDVSVNRVQHLEFQFQQCLGNLLCLAPLIQEIELDKIRLPQSIKSEVLSVEGLLTTLKLSVSSCATDNVSEYTAGAFALLHDITVCINNVLG